MNLSGQEIGILIIGILMGALLGYLRARISFAALAKELRKDAVTRSKSVVIGQVSEALAPILPGFPYSPKDLTFIGKGIDYVVFHGLYAGEIQEVIFLEIKSGNAQLNSNERQIKNAIQHGRIRYEILRL